MHNHRRTMHGKVFDLLSQHIRNERTGEVEDTTVKHTSDLWCDEVCLLKKNGLDIIAVLLAL